MILCQKQLTISYLSKKNLIIFSLNKSHLELILRTELSKTYKLILIKMSGQSLDYTILNKNDFQIVDGELKSIFQKNSQGFYICSKSQDFKLNLDLKLKKKSLVQVFQIKTLSDIKITFELIGQNNTVHQTMTYYLTEVKTCFFEARGSYTNKKETTRVKIEIECLQETQGIIGLCFILIRGQKCEEENKDKSASRVSRQNDEFQQPKIEKIFKFGTPKTKETKQHIISSNKRNNHDVQKIYDESEDSQYRKAIQQSKKQAQRYQKQRETTNRKQISEFKTINQFSNNNNTKQRGYTLIDFDLCKSIFKDVNSTWIQAQRAAETERGVWQNQRLSKKISENSHVKTTNRKDKKKK